VPVNLRRAGHSRLRVSCSRFRWDGLRMEKRVFRDCRLYEGQGAKVLVMLGVNSIKMMPGVGYRALKAKGKISVQGACYFINKIIKCIFSEKKNG
jgi:hypothetical protein